MGGSTNFLLIRFSNLIGFEAQKLWKFQTGSIRQKCPQLKKKDETQYEPRFLTFNHVVNDASLKLQRKTQFAAKSPFDILPNEGVP